MEMNDQRVPLTEAFVRTLADGARMPLLGFGTWQLDGDLARRNTVHALRTGYRHIDTAARYGNEADIGHGLRDMGLPREEVFVTTKAWPDPAHEERATLEQSLARLGLDYVDLWLVHWPPDDIEARVAVWETFLGAREDGLARSIGVSNFSVRQLDELTARTSVAPAVNQVEWSPFLFDADHLDSHESRGVALQGWSPFKSSQLDHPELLDIAAARQCTPAQIIIRWHLEHGVAVIPRSSQPARIEANADVLGFRLDDDDLARLDALGGLATPTFPS